MNIDKIKKLSPGAKNLDEVKDKMQLSELLEAQAIIMHQTCKTIEEKQKFCLELATRNNSTKTAILKDYNFYLQVFKIHN